MIIINKKRIQIIIAGLLIAIFAFSFQIAGNTTKEQNQEKQNTVQTTATPVSGRTVVIDAGHGVPDEGAQSSTRYNRSTNKFENCSKITKFIGSKWKHSHFNTFR
ncbi:MAG: hypothetical protein HFJ36_06290 [Clostridia bacterium]|nr:hypothetical protein [Clostridia bacterium]